MISSAGRAGACAWMMTAAFSALGALAASGVEAAPAPRVAVLVGANAAAPGRRPLLFGHRDAEAMAKTLLAVGGFRPDDVHVLRDPSPSELLAVLELQIGRLADTPESLLYFYYSGHADERAVYPAGQPLAMDELRRRLDRARVAVKVGMVDACRGGAWTRAKGLRPEEPFALSWPVSLGSEGSVLIASSSGLESAHESNELQGSFFTFHFTAGLRGAADRNGDAQITLTEVFEYAKQKTIRDTARLAPEAQHPSYAVNLRGRRDLVLAYVDASPSSIEVAQEEGPLQVLHVDSGLELVELPAGRRVARLAVPPGRYLVRKPGRGGNLIKEIAIAAGTRARVQEAELTEIASARLGLKAVQAEAVRTSASAAIVPAAPQPTQLDATDARQRPALAVNDATATRGSAPAIASSQRSSAAPRPEPVKPSPALRGAAWATAGAAVAGVFGWAYFGLQVKDANRDLDFYRRVPCGSGVESLGFGCRADGSAATEPLRPADSAYVNSREADVRRSQQYQDFALGAGAVLAATSAVLFYFSWRPADRTPDVALAPVLDPTHAGVVGRIQF